MAKKVMTSPEFGPPKTTGKLPPLKTLVNIHAKGAKVEEAYAAFNGAVSSTLHEVRERGDRSADLVQLFSKLRTAQDILAAQVKIFAEALSMLESKLIPEAFEREEIQTLTTADGDRMTVVQKLYASILAAKRSDAYEWLRDNGHEAMIQETVNTSSLSAFAKAELTEGRELPEELFTVFYKPSVLLTRKK